MTASALKHCDFLHGHKEPGPTEYTTTRVSVKTPKEPKNVRLQTPAPEIIVDPLPPKPCKTPRFGPGQVTIGSSAIYESDRFGYVKVLPDSDNPAEILIIPDILDAKARADYLTEALKVDRPSGKTAYGYAKPRKELFYSPSGDTYHYSGKKHRTTVYPEHVSKAIVQIMKAIDDRLSEDDEIVFTNYKVSVSGDIKYDSDMPLGGSCGAHSDDEMKWPLIIIYSLGQSRWIRFRNKATGKYTNIEMADNSVVIMFGQWFQADYTHQVDKLTPGEEVGTRLSLNIRYEYDNTY